MKYPSALELCEQTALQRDEKKSLDFFPPRDLLVIKRHKVYLGGYFMRSTPVKNTCNTGLIFGGLQGVASEDRQEGIASVSLSFSLKSGFLHTSDSH